MGGDAAVKEKTYTTVCEFARLFKERSETIICFKLLGINLLNGDKQAPAEHIEKDLSQNGSGYR